jgi:hypothetical protein
MSVPQEDTKNNFLRGHHGELLDCDAFGHLRRPTTYLQRLLANGGLFRFVTSPQVLADNLAGVQKAYSFDPEFGDDLRAHHAGVVGELGHVIVATPRLASVQARLLESGAVSKMLAGRPNWRTRALLAAAAIEYRLPILGASRFYRVLSEERDIPAGVLDPQTGAWLVPPAS